MFEEEYARLLRGYLERGDTPYARYLKSIAPHQTHAGYFSVDRQGRQVDSPTRRGSDESDDVSAYELILKDKERLLSLTEPVRFIFSHSALREGWDNPNVFQICTLKRGGTSPTQKRQEVGRGLRLCVNQNGERMDAEKCGDKVHEINVLTVIASEGYREFACGLQAGIKEALYERPGHAAAEYFACKTVTAGGRPHTITEAEAEEICRYLAENGYIDGEGRVTKKYRAELESGRLAPLPETLARFGDGVHLLLQSMFDESVLDRMVENAAKSKKTARGEDFYKKEFQALYGRLDRAHEYAVEFDSRELVRKAIKHINENMSVNSPRFTVAVGRQADDSGGFSFEHAEAVTLEGGAQTRQKYDLLGKIAPHNAHAPDGCGNSPPASTAARSSAFAAAREFIAKAIRLICEQKSAAVIEHITCGPGESEYKSTIFTAGNMAGELIKALHVADAAAENCAETGDEVCIFSKLPRGFAIPTPLGSCAPEWAVAFREGLTKNIYFIAPSKGSLESLRFVPTDKSEPERPDMLLERLSAGKARFFEADGYRSLVELLSGI